MRRHLAAALCLVLALPALCHAGLYYSGEPMADLPSQWRGFLMDQQALRMIAAKTKPGAAVHPLRAQYQQAATDLEKAKQARPLSAEELADLGAICLRLGEVSKALEILRGAAADHPKHFHIAANLGTAWQLQGDLQQAALALKQAVLLAPGKQQTAEEYQLKLVQLRAKDKTNNPGLDALFGVHYRGENGKYVAGKIAAAEKQKLPSKAVAIMQQLCLWLPADGRLLWQLAEVANAYGDVKTAAGMLDGCIVQFGLKHKELREHRDILRVAVEQLAKAGKEAHEGHVGGIPALSKRPLLTKFNENLLPPINGTGINKLPWLLLMNTRLDAKLRPTFPKYLEDLNGKKITLHGFMQPFKDDADVASFMLIEYPVGCWFCEMPEITGIVLVEMPKGKTFHYSRETLRVTGTLELNFADPEEFLYTIRNAQVGGVD